MEQTGSEKAFLPKSCKSYTWVSAFLVYFLYIFWIASALLPVIVVIRCFLGNSFHYLGFYIFFVFMSKIFFGILRCFPMLKDILAKHCCEARLDFFNHEIKNLPAKSPTSKVMVAEFPHGIFCIGFTTNCWILDTFKHSMFDLLSMSSPFGDFVNCYGAIGCSKHVLNRYMQHGTNIHILPGGFHEIVLAENMSYNLYVPTGFIALSLRHGYSIIPVLNLGENETFTIFPLPNSLKRFIFKNIFPYVKAPVFLGLGKYFGVTPFPVPILSIFGNEIECKLRDGETTEKAIDRIHKDVCVQLTCLFEKNIGTYCKKNGLEVSNYRFSITNNKK